MPFFFVFFLLFLFCRVYLKFKHTKHLHIHNIYKKTSFHIFHYFLSAVTNLSKKHYLARLKPKMSLNIGNHNTDQNNCIEEQISAMASPNQANSPMSGSIAGGSQSAKNSVESANQVSFSKSILIKHC